MAHIERDLFVCSCCSPEHQMIVTNFVGADEAEDKELYLSIHLARQVGLLRRLRYALTYLLNRSGRYGPFEEIILDPKDMQRLRDVLDRKLKETPSC